MYRLGHSYLVHTANPWLQAPSLTRITLLTRRTPMARHQVRRLRRLRATTTCRHTLPQTRIRLMVILGAMTVQQDEDAGGRRRTKMKDTGYPLLGRAWQKMTTDEDRLPNSPTIAVLEV